MSVYWDKKLVESLVKDLISHADYDLSKELDPETAEEPEFAERFMDELCNIVWSYVDASKREPV